MKEITSEVLNKDLNGMVFIYTKFCGTCHVARSFLDKIEATHQQNIFKSLNGSFEEEFLHEFKIESVPCLLILEDGQVKEKIYTFYSIANIYHYILKYRPEVFSPA